MFFLFFVGEEEILGNSHFKKEITKGNCVKGLKGNVHVMSAYSAI